MTNDKVHIMKHKLTLGDALGVLISAAEVRRDQWAGVGEGKRPDELIDELWESAGSGNLEAQNMEDLIGHAIDVVREARTEHFSSFEEKIRKANTL